MNKMTVKVSAALLLAAGLAACANDQTKADNTELNNRVAAAEKAAADAQAAAQAAQAAAQQAQRTAEQAMSAAQQNDKKVDRAFKKSQQK